MRSQAATIAPAQGTDLVASARSPARLLSTVAVLAVALVAGTARADVVTEWDVIAFDTFKAANIGGNPQFRALAIMHVAMSDAVTTPFRTATHATRSRSP